MNSRVLPILALMVAVGIFFVYVNPEWTGAIAQTKAAIAADNQALAAADQFTQTENQLASERSNIDPSNLSALETLLPDSVDNVGLILDLDALAARAGLALSNVDVANSTSGQSSQSGASTSGTSGSGTQDMSAQPTSPVGQVDLSLSAVGTYDALRQFLAGVERSQRLLDVRDLSVQSSKTGVYNYKMTIRLYWLR